MRLKIRDMRFLMGDGVLGKKLENNARIGIISNHIRSESNGVRTFVFSGVLENPNGVTPSYYHIHYLYCCLCGW